MRELDRMLADNQNSNRMNQLKLIAKTSAEVALLAVGIQGKGLLVKATGNMKTPGPILDFGSKATAKEMTVAAGKKIKEGAVKTLKKGTETLGNKIVGRIPEIRDLKKAQQGLASIKDALASFKGGLSGDANGKINAASKLVFGEGDLTHGVVGYGEKVLKAAEGKPSNYALKVITGGEKQLDHKIGQITTDLLKDTKEMLESAKKDAESENRDEADIKALRKA